jgi:hypothetical protein
MKRNKYGKFLWLHRKIVKMKEKLAMFEARYEAIRFFCDHVFPDGKNAIKNNACLICKKEINHDARTT